MSTDRESLGRHLPEILPHVWGFGQTVLGVHVLRMPTRQEHLEERNQERGKVGTTPMTREDERKTQ